MGIKRQKAYRKLIQQYELGFGFRPPFQVLVTADLILMAYRCKMNLGALLQKTLSGTEVKPMITQCCIRHLYDLEANTPEEKKEKNTCIDVAKAAERRRCGHHELDEPLSALECLLSVVDAKGNGTNKNRYVVATQDVDIRRRLRQIAGVPLIYINRSVMILEPMAAKTEEVRKKEENSKFLAGLKTRRTAANTGAKRKRDEDEPEGAKAAEGEKQQGEAEQTQKKRKLKGPKGPNPLSVKKAKKEKEKPAGKQGEDQRSTARKVSNGDGQAAEKALDAQASAKESAMDSQTEGAHKRKRKRKGKEGHESGEAGAGAALAVED
jgi:U3 small nucleolar RNA-associated protein 23